MPAKIIDGKKISENIISELKNKIKDMKQKPGIALILVGDNPASKVYVSSKEKKCKEAGIYCERHNLSKDILEMNLLKLIGELNQNKKINGILVQLPLPKQINERLVIESILPYKDVDGFSPLNFGNLAQGNTIIAPATPRAIINIIESTKAEIEGKHAVVVGRSNIVGKPVAIMLLEKNATVTICHSRTKNLKEIAKQADILVAAVGKPKLIKKDMVKEGAVVIAVGINRVGGKIVGDVDFENVKEVAGFITPVPGGVGPMTIAMLMDNLLKAKELSDRMLS